MSGYRFGVLGPLEVYDGAGTVLPITRRKPRLLLALLVFRANSVVPTATLVDHLWGEQPPASAVANLQSYVTELRRVLATPDVAGAERLQTGPGGYRLRVDEGESDLGRFTELAGRGADELAAGAPAAAMEHLSAALALWRGPVLSGLELPEALHPDVQRLEETRVRATEHRAHAWLDLGCHAVATAELRALTGQYPLRERPWELLMLALHRGGRTDEALAAYQRARQVLADELGVEPGSALRRMQHAILTADPAIEAPPEPVRDAAVRPRQLPSNVATVVGRAALLSTLDELAGAAGARPAAVVLTGPAGVGKTTLAVRWAHRAAPHFPDGQLFADLQGYAPAPALPALQVLTGFLHALGVRPGQVPTEQADAAALYRSILADRRVLVVLDNVATPEQVRALLPGSPGSAVLITSRDRLAGLTATVDTRVLPLPELSADDSVALLADVLGPERVAAEEDTARQLAKLCAGLPLALRIVAANLLHWPDQPLAGYFAELTGGDLLAKLKVAGDERLGLRRTLDFSYDGVSDAAGEFFCLLGSVPGAEISVAGAAALAGTDVAGAADLLRELVASHLVQPRGADRFGMHDLLRAYAVGRAAEDLKEQTRNDALGRLFEHYLRTADRAAQALYPDFRRLPDDRSAETAGTPFAPGEARQWLLAEHPNLLAAIRWAAGHGPAAVAWRLADVLRGFFHSHRLDAEWEAAATAGLAAAEQAGDRQAAGAMRHSLGVLAWGRGNYRQALAELGAARECYLAAGALDGADSVLQAFGAVHLDLGQLEAAIEHFTAALAAAEERGTEAQVANSLINLGAALLDHGDLADGIRHNERAFAICRSVGSAHAAAIAQCNLGYGYRATGQLRRAREVLTEALACLRELGSRDDEADALVRLAAVHRITGDAAARACAVQAIAVAREAGNRRFETDALSELGHVHRLAGETDSARGCYLETRQQAGAIGYRRGEIIAAIGLSVVDPGQALAQAADALRLAERGGFRPLAELARLRLAAAALDHGDSAAAEAYAGQAIEELRRAGYRLGEADAWVVLGRIRLARAGPEAARACAHEAEALVRDTDAGTVMVRVRTLLAATRAPQPCAPAAPVPPPRS
ncbi:AfsR/SARP family transcriptional regulator [Amycolatopsis tolypomycina]|uniref:AfsR/SARP family transcriptional regulator n=1 Tax=Amycolatopsis tolypomycina TaxID=208445 RepID=UPI0033A3437F